MKKVSALLISLLLVSLTFPPLTGAKGRSANPPRLAGKGKPSSPKRTAGKNSPLPPKQLPPEGDLTTLAGLGQAEASSITLDSRSDVNRNAEGPDSFPSAEEMEEFRQRRAQRPKKQWPYVEGPPARPSEISQPTELSVTDLPGLENDNDPQAPNDMTTFRSHAFSTVEVPSNLRSAVQEPTVINMGNTVFYTGNWYAAKSADGGNTFTFINPFSFFPSVDDGFCCDQVTAYAPAQDMALWGLQYSQTATGNTFRVARAIGGAGVANNSWLYWDFTPQSFGYASGIWFDFPNLTVTSTHLLITTTPFSAGSPSTLQGAIIIRIPLSQLAAGGSVSMQSLKITGNVSPVRCAEGATSTAYCAALVNSSQIRIYRWDDASSTIFNDLVNLNSFTYYVSGGVATSPDGTNWAGHSDSRPLGVYVSRGIIGVMFNARQDGSFPYPYVVHARFSEASRALVSQSPIWNPNYAYLYPSVTPNANGDLAGTLQIGGGSAANGFPYPGTVFWVSDSVQPSDTSVGGLYSIVNSTAGPIENKWGDYFSVRRHKDYPNTWVVSGHILNGGQSDSFAQPRYYWIGREKDGPTGSSQNGKGSDTVGLYSPSDSTFFLRNTNLGGSADIVFGYGPANAGWKPLAGDWNGDGVDTVGFYSPSQSAFYLRNSNTQGGADITFFYGPANAGWIPIAGDWNGDGVDTVGLYNPGQSAFYLRNTNSQGNADVTFFYGPAFGGWQPIAGDWNGDGVDSAGLYNPGQSAFYLRNSNSQGGADITFFYGPANGGWTPIAGDWDNDRTCTVGLHNPGQSAFYLRNTNSQGNADVTFFYGPAGGGWIPIAGDWNGS